jgi:hypothetical protein
VRVPTLLIVGDADTRVLAPNQEARRELAGPTRLEVIPGATHLFPEPRALEQVARLAAAWFDEHLDQPDDVHSGPFRLIHSGEGPRTDTGGRLNGRIREDVPG